MSPPSPTEHRDTGVDGGARSVRFDKWLWAARFYRTRSLAARAVDAGQARLNGDRVKPAHPVHIGDAVNVRKERAMWTVDVTGITDRRGPATAAAALYVERPESRSAREEEAARQRAAAALAPRFAGRPTKRERRRLEDFLDEA